MEITKETKDKAAIAIYLIFILMVFMLGYSIAESATYQRVKDFYENKYKMCFCYQNNKEITYNASFSFVELETINHTE